MNKKILLVLLTLCGPAFAQTAHPPVNGNVTITSATSTARTQLPVLASAACTIYAKAGNTGIVYVGGSTVTNASGANVGIPLSQTGSLSDLSVTNSSAIFVAADTANDKVTWVCN